MHISGYLFSIKDNFQTLFGLKDEQKKGRTVMMGSSVLSSIITSLTSGIFYTGFLLGNDIHLTSVGIITFIPYLASLISLFAPSLLERFPKRRWLLALLRLLQWTINLLGMTLLPLIVKDSQARIIWFCILSFLGSALGNLCTPGYTTWHLNFIPDSVRASYLITSALITNVLCGLFLILSGIAADAMAGSPYQMTIITLLRYIGFALAVLEVWLMTRPKEYPYPILADKPQPSQVFTLPFRNRRFLKTEGINILYLFIANLTSAVLNAYLLSSIGVSYTLINAINLCYALFLILFGPFWRRRIAHLGWLRTLSFTLLGLAPTYMMYALIRPGNYLWLYPLMRLIQHFVGVGHDTCVGNLLYLNIPSEGRTNYVSFNTLATNLAALLAMMTGTWIVSRMGDAELALGPLSFSSVPLLLLATALGYIGLSVLVRHQASSLEPER